MTLITSKSKRPIQHSPIGNGHPLTNGLKAWWPLSSWNRGGASAIDSVSRADATLTNMDWSGRPDVMTFDGTDDYLTVSLHPAFNPLPNGITISQWVKPTGANYGGITSDGGGLWVLYGSSTDRIHLKYTSSSSGRVRLFNDIDNVGSGSTVAADYDTNLNEWSHFVTVCDGDSWKIYINGVLAHTDTKLGAWRIDSGTVYFDIGRKRQTTARYFRGEMKDVRFWHRPLPEAECLLLATEPFFGLFEKARTYFIPAANAITLSGGGVVSTDLTAVVASVTSDTAGGTLYYVAQESTVGAPTAAQIKLGQDGDGTTTPNVQSGSIS